MTHPLHIPCIPPLLRAMLGMLLLVLTLGAAVPSDPARVALFALRVFDERDGLPQNTVESLTVDAEGFIWVGTQDGPMRYDGHTLQRLALPDPQDGAWVQTIIPALGGGLWFGTNGGGLHQYRAGTWTSFKARTGVGISSVLSLLELPPGNRAEGLWVGTRTEGLWRIRYGKAERVAVPWGQQPPWIHQLHASVDAQGRTVLMLATGRGLWRWDGDAWTEVALKGRGKVGEVLSLVESTEGSERTLWLGTPQGLLRGKLPELHELHTVPELAGRRVITLATSPAETAGHHLWVGTDRGLFMGGVGDWRLLDAQSGLPSTRVMVVRTLLRAGRPPLVFAGTFAGLVRLSPWGWRSVTTRAGLTENVVLTVNEDLNGDFLVGTGGGGLNILRQGRWECVDQVQGRQARIILRIQTTRQGTLWLGTPYDGLIVREGATWRWWEGNAQLPDKGIFALHEDSEGRFWVGTRRGLARVQKGGSETMSTPYAIPPFVVALADTQELDGSRTLWAGTRNLGLLRLRKGAWTRFGRAQGLPGEWVHALRVQRSRDGREVLWVGFNTGGAVAFDPTGEGRVITTISTASTPPLPSDVVHQVEIDPQDRVYFGTNRGVARLTPDPLALGGYRVTHFTTGDGLPSLGMTSGGSYLDRKGRVWAGTLQGAAFLDPLSEPAGLQPAPLRLTQAQVLSEGRALRPDETLSHKARNLVFEAALLSFHRDADVAYRVQLEGMDAVPGPWGPERRREYSALPPGGYTFKIWGRDHAGIESGPVTFPFAIDPPPWASWWANSLYVMGLFGAIGGVSRWRTRSLMRRNVLLEEEITKRTRELRVRNSELEGLDVMVQAINRELSLDDLLRSLVHQAQEHFPAAQAGSILIRDEAEGAFRVEASYGFAQETQVGITFPEEALLARYVECGERLGEGVYLVQDLTQAPEGQLRQAPTPLALLAMSMEFEGRREGFLVLDNFEDPEAFKGTDVERLVRFRSHAISAFAKSRMLARLARAADRLQELNQQKNQFLSIVVHDLRNPLSGILLATDAMQEVEDAASIAQMVAHIRREGVEMDQLIGRFLDIAAIESGRVRSEPEPLQLGPFLADMARRHGPRAEAKGIRLLTRCQGNVLPAWVDPRFTREVVDNLVSNALKFSPPDRQVVLEARTEGSRVVLLVQDQGPGLTAEDRLRLFSRFAKLSARPTGGEKSTGLGLSIVKHLVEAMDGRVWVESEPGQGATFHVELPAWRVSVD